MEAKGFFIIGFPTESHESIRTTIDFAKRLKLTDISVNYLTPLPGSPVYHQAHNYGWFDDDWGEMNFMNVVFVPNGLTADDLRYYCKRMWREFYLRPRIIWAYIKRGMAHPRLLGELGRGAFALIRTVFS